MIMIDSGTSAARRRIADIGHMLARMMAQARERRRIRRDMIALSDLPDHLLSDMGLHDLGALREPNVCDRLGWRKNPMWRHWR